MFEEDELLAGDEELDGSWAVAEDETGWIVPSWREQSLCRDSAKKKILGCIVPDSRVPRCVSDPRRCRELDADALSGSLSGLFCSEERS